MERRKTTHHLSGGCDRLRALSGDSHEPSQLRKYRAAHPPRQIEKCVNRSMSGTGKSDGATTPGLITLGMISLLVGQSLFA